MFKVKKAFVPKAQLCQVCGLRPQQYDKGTGKFRPFCGVTCAAKIRESDTAVCDHCRQHSRFGSYLYCSKTCATAAEQQKTEACSLTGCTDQATRYPVGTHWNYCSVGHEELALRGCIYCRAVPYIGEHLPMCGPCNTYLVGHGPFILPLPQDHTTYWAVADQFNAAWAHPTKPPEIRMVYRIVAAPSVWNKYWAYRGKLEAKGKFATRGGCPGNEHLLWHGTTRNCNLGEPGQLVFCASSKCSLCSIARGSYNMSRAKTGAWQRYGPGIYTSTKSSKANDYAKNLVKSTWKAMFLNNVLAGREYTTEVSEPHLTGPPSGYNSVYGEPGKDLNYDELVVYTEHAIRPAYLVMYE